MEFDGFQFYFYKRFIDMAAIAKNKSVQFDPTTSISYINRTPKENLVAPLYMYPTGQASFLNPHNVNKNTPTPYFLKNSRHRGERTKFLEILRKINQLPESDKAELQHVLTTYPSNEYFNTIHKLEPEINGHLVLQHLNSLIVQLEPGWQKEINAYLHAQNKTNIHAYIRKLHELIPIVEHKLKEQEQGITYIGNRPAGGYHKRRTHRKRRTQKK
jgi:hypothetical protein